MGRHLASILKSLLPVSGYTVLMYLYSIEANPGDHFEVTVWVLWQFQTQTLTAGCKIVPYNNFTNYRLYWRLTGCISGYKTVIWMVLIPLKGEL